MEPYMKVFTSQDLTQGCAEPPQMLSVVSE